MHILQNVLISLVISAQFKRIHSFCEDSYIVICDALSDIKENDTTQWRHLLIGSPQTFQIEDELQVMDTSRLNNVKELTVINQLKLIKSPFVTNLIASFEYLNFYKNNINQIRDYTFRDLKHLREIYLKQNNIFQLGREIFPKNLLEIVDLSGNEIGAITTCFLHSNIRKIVINNNKLTYIAPSAFPKSLVQLHLDFNRLSTLDPDVFKDLKSLKELSMRNNDLVALPVLSYLKSIRFLHFSDNKIEAVDQLFNQSNLEYLDLSSNLIRSIFPSFFTTTKNSPLVILSFNQLTNLVFEFPENKTDLVLYGNPWNCDCLNNIQNIVEKYQHSHTCEMDCFTKGEAPTCIENGKCGENEMRQSDIDNFQQLARLCQNKNMCDFKF